MWREKPPSAPRWFGKVNWESLAVHLPRFKAKVEGEQEKNPTSGVKRKNRNIRITAMHSAFFFLLLTGVFCVFCNINDELNSPKNCIGVQHESTFTSFPFSLWCRNLTEVLSRAAMLLALYKVLVYSDWSSWKKKSHEGLYKVSRAPVCRTSCSLVAQEIQP